MTRIEEHIKKFDKLHQKVEKWLQNDDAKYKKKKPSLMKKLKDKRKCKVI